MPAQLQAAIDKDELAALEAQWGILPRSHTVLEVDDPFLTGEHQMLVKDGRRAEICYIMHQGRPADGLLLHIKTVYPAGAYRLPTGGIHKGEAVMETLAREISEETGLCVGTGPDHVRVQRMLGVVGYELAHRGLGRRFGFATYHFLVQMPTGAVLQPQDPDEMIGGWRWCPLAELPAVALTLDGVGLHTPQWADWGHYRTISHRFVAEQLAA